MREYRLLELLDHRGCFNVTIPVNQIAFTKDLIRDKGYLLQVFASDRLTYGLAKLPWWYVYRYVKIKDWSWTKHCMKHDEWEELPSIIKYHVGIQGINYNEIIERNDFDYHAQLNGLLVEHMTIAQTPKLLAAEEWKRELLRKKQNGFTKTSIQRFFTINKG